MIGGLYATEENLEAERTRIEQRNRNWVAAEAASPFCRWPSNICRSVGSGSNLGRNPGRKIAVPQPGEEYARKLQKEMAKGLHFDWS